MRVRRLLAALLVLTLAATGTALAGRGDPQKRIVAADQARAKAMLLRTADFGLGFRTSPAPPDSDDFYCKALDESDLTLTGEAQSPTFAGGVEAYTSASQVYETKADSSASWRRGTSAAGEQCVRKEFTRLLARQGTRLESFGRVPFPRLAEKSVAYRLVISSQGIRAFLDVVALKQGRAQVSVLFTSGLTPVPKEEEIRLARVVASRMAKAMRGA
jgi:hypothetical protein